MEKYIASHREIMHTGTVGFEEMAMLVKCL